MHDPNAAISCGLKLSLEKNPPSKLLLSAST